MSGLFDDEGKTPARGRKHKASEAVEAELQSSVDAQLAAAQRAFTAREPVLAAEIGSTLTVEVQPGHPFEDSIKAAKAIADDIHPGQGVAVHKDRALGPSTVNLGIPRSAEERIDAAEREQVNRFPISQERRAKLLNLVWERTRWRTGRVEWRDFRELLKDVIELL